MDKVYIQVYSIREQLQDFKGAMRKLKDMGYAGVEFASNYGGMNAKDLKSFLDDTGLDCISAHIGFDQTPEMIDYMAEVGARYIICPMARINNYDEAMQAAETINKLGELCAKSGLKYGYHNHTGEFAKVGDKYILDVMIENTDPAKAIFQLDVGWCVTAGVDAVEYINSHAGRFEMIHAKEAGKVVGVENPIDFSKVKFGPDKRPIFTPEMIEALNERMRMNVPTGKGLIDWSIIKKTADAQGAKAYIVEREWDYAGDIFQCVKEDVEFLSKI